MAKKASASATNKPRQSAPTSRSLKSQLAKLDKEIAEAIADRAELVQELAKAGAEPLGSAAAETTIGGPQGAVDAAAMQAIFREVVASSRALVHSDRVAYLGPEDSFSHLTAIRLFGQASELVPVATIRGVFDEVGSGGCQQGVVPLENSTHGRVTDTLEAFSCSKVQIAAEAPTRIHHCLLGRGKRSGVKRVYSKPQALSQCNHWLAEHLPGAELHAAASTSEAARIASEEKGVAAIASEQAGRRHGLEVLARNIEDQKDNVTRFAVISLESPPKTGDDKTALMMEIDHQPGSLADAMAIFKRQKLNMTWIESFPIPGSRSEDQTGGRYLFFVEFVGHQSELRVRRALASLEKRCVQLRVLGSYARSPVLD